MPNRNRLGAPSGAPAPVSPVDVEAVNQRFRIALESARMLVFEWDIQSDAITLDGQGLGPNRQLFKEELSSSKSFARRVHPDDASALHPDHDLSA